MSYDSVALMRNQANNADMKIAIIKFVKLQDTINFPFYMVLRTRHGQLKKYRRTHPDLSNKKISAERYTSRNKPRGKKRAS
jgi:hypothetical protein